eukprot:TRINITY_DN23282_c0_g1_i1.p1 TRINITY_DN23282_c0_g1~~TRINITY_DN23282_c0_g1_i1.p1  ORF type:complete len:467 (-),score=68.31 TRINITY_DN23282_c0_g1_i1:54-1454(-)
MPFKRARWEAAYNGRYSDVVFVVGREPRDSNEASVVRRFPATRALFAMASDVLEAMLCRPAGEPSFQDSMEGEVRIEDVSPDAFDQLCRHVHHLELQLTMENVMGVLRAADKYEIRDLIRCCRQFLKSSMLQFGSASLEGLLKLLDSTHDLQRNYGPPPPAITEVVMLAREILAACGLSALEHKLAVALEVEDVISILTSARLVASEETVWKAMLAWAGFKSAHSRKDRIELAQKLVGAVRFHEMNQIFFVEEVMGSGVLGNDDIIAILAHFVHPSAIRAIHGGGVPRPRVALARCYGVTIVDQTVTCGQTGVWPSAVFFQVANSNDFSIELVTECDVSIDHDSPRFMIGFSPTESLDGRDNFMSQVDGDKYFFHVATHSFHNCHLELHSQYPGSHISLGVGSHVTMRYTGRNLTFRIDTMPPASVPSQHLPPAGYSPCLLLNRNMSVQVLGLHPYDFDLPSDHED